MANVRVLCVFGTRPEAIKMAAVVRSLASTSGVESRVCVTAQHRRMLDQVLSFFDIEPHHDLDLMESSQTLHDVTSRILHRMSAVLENENPDIVLVHGDTNTTMSTALAAYYQKIPVGHVEAGLRTGNVYSPWPEEINRRIAGVIASIHFAPTDVAKENLLRENVDSDTIFVTGNTVIDALLWTRARVRADEAMSGRMRRTFSFLDQERTLILVTGHRRENFGRGFEEVCSALRELARRDDVEIVFPVHRNPKVRGPVEEALSTVGGIHLLDPLDYPSFVYLMDHSSVILTDSGGVQEEAPSLGKPVLVMRNTTERPEAVRSGTVRIVGTDKERIIEETCRLLDDESARAEMSLAQNPYGDGRAAPRIVDHLLAYAG